MINILHLYPSEMNIYGDRGNVMALVQRLAWRGIDARVIYAGVGDNVDFSGVDIIFAGGGQDKGQIAVGKDLATKARNLFKAADDGMPILTICGTYQLFGSGFKPLGGPEIPGIGIFKAKTVAGQKRLVGNVVIESPYGQIVGFENHSGQTFLEAGQTPLGKVIKGFGNNGKSGEEGAVYHNVFGTYLHGPLLPKNPTLADALIAVAVKRKLGMDNLPPLDDALEMNAHLSATARPQ